MDAAQRTLMVRFFELLIQIEASQLITNDTK